MITCVFDKFFKQQSLYSVCGLNSLFATLFRKNMIIYSQEFAS